MTLIAIFRARIVTELVEMEGPSVTQQTAISFTRPNPGQIF
jgi:hypothetical protein